MVKNREQSTSNSTNVLSKIKLYLSRNKLGEILVNHKKISPRDLKSALRKQKQTNVPLGRVLLAQRIVTRKTLYNTLLHQATIRCVAGACALFIMAYGANHKTAEAKEELQKDKSLKITFASTNHMSGKIDVTPAPKIFGADGEKYTDMKAFTKWWGMFEAFETALKTPEGQDLVSTWKAELVQYKNLPVLEMAKAINKQMNAKPYIEDVDNWNRSDYWANPVEFNERGGDCEDFAIAKYIALRSLGVPERKLRLAIVHDMQRDMPHAVLIVLDKGHSYVLDNQMKTVRDTSSTSRYFPIYSINQQAWWLHNDPAEMKMVTASR